MLIAIAAFLRMTDCAYQCDNDYEPSMYKNNNYERVPTTCDLSSQPDCPRSWKSGVTQGKSTELPLIDELFVRCHEGFLTCGYVPIDSNTGEVLGHSGVTVGAGVDLGTKSSSSLSAIGVPTSIISQLEPYFGLMKDNAACAAIELPLQMTQANAETLTELVRTDIVMQVQQRYDQERKSDTVEFISLPRGIRTAIFDVWFVFGTPAAYPIFWTHVTNNDWESAIKELRDFYRPSASPKRGERIRRSDEADIIEAALANCSRSIDLVFLVDESGSIGSSDFRDSLDFIRNVINAFPDEVLADTERGTRFGLSLFDDSYRSRFYLSDYTSKYQYFAALSAVWQNGGGTYLGSALDRVSLDQFTEDRGLRDESYGLPRILVVMTDGRSGDEVEEPAKNITARNIVIYAIGIGNYDYSQLNAVASSPDHFYPLSSFSDLADFAATLTASTCYEPQPISLETTVNGRVKQEEFQYYTFIVRVDVYLKAEISDTQGNTLVYASRDNPHPYEYDSDFGFSSASQANKVIVISPIPQSDGLTKRQETTYPIYVSVAGASSNASYTIVGSTCDPAECSEGTNESPSRASMLQLCMLLLTVACGVAIGENLF